MQTKARVVLYTRPGCHLCEEARREMLAAGCAEQYELAEVNINDDPALAARYGWDIPVIAIDGRETFKHRLTARQFRREILSALKSRKRSDER